MSSSIEYVRGIFARLGENVTPQTEAIFSEFVADARTQSACRHLQEWEDALISSWRTKIVRSTETAKPEPTGPAIPVYLLLDTSGSMWGERIAAVNNGLQTMVARLRQDQQLVETVFISIITFDARVSQVLPLTQLRHLKLPEIQCPQSGPTNMGAALMMLIEKSRSDRFNEGEWRPMVYLMTDGAPSDLGVFREAVQRIRLQGFCRLVACAVGADAKDVYLRELTDIVLHLDTVDSATLTKFIEYIGSSIALADPPREVYVDL